MTRGYAPGVGSEGHPPWVLAILGFPLAGAALWLALVYSADEVLLRTTPVLALPALLTLAVARARRTGVGASMGLALASVGITGCFAALPLIWITFFAGIG